ncbi:hypothetical protein [Campylobacter sp. TTU-622]|uniref:hypothetical protein n=1 Tax=Campylobacter sp. TTU-622 TaxID=2800583 RepID=UPI001F336A35|nr:hypothetical protein [Campylobacter sp. TTU-622]
MIEKLEELQCDFTIIQNNSEIPAMAKNPFEKRIIEIFYEMDFQVLQAKDLNNNTIYFLWDNQREKYYLENKLRENYLASVLKKEGLIFKDQGDYCLVDNFKIIDCFSSSSLEILIDFIPDDYFEDYEIEFVKMSKDLIKHYGLNNVANETEINALSYALQDCCTMYCNQNNKIGLTSEQIDDFKKHIIERYVKGDNEPDNMQGVEDIVYSLHYSMMISLIPVEIIDELDRDLAINKVEMSIDGNYQVSFLCDDVDSFLGRIKEYIMFGGELNEYAKFCIKNTDNFYEFDFLDGILITEDIFNVKKHIENALNDEIQNKELALKICSDLLAYHHSYHKPYLKICLEDIKEIKNLQNNEGRKEFLKDLLHIEDEEFDVFEEVIKTY